MYVCVRGGEDVFVPVEPGGETLDLSGLKATLSGNSGLLTGLSE